MSTDPSETKNYQRFIAAFIDIGTEILLKLLYYKKPKHELKNFLSSKDTDLKRDLSMSQYKKVKLAKNTDKFDISLLLALLSSLFGFKGNEDLKQIRKIRNNIVAHSTKATLDDKKYCGLFKNLHTIIYRIAVEFDTAYADSLTTKIKQYKESTPGPSRVVDDMAKLQEWRDELAEESMKNKNDLKLFFSSENKRFKSYIQLLIDAVPKVLEGFLRDQLEQRRQTVEEFLMQNQAFFMENLRNQDAFSQLFKIEADGTATAHPDINWDVCVIAEVLLIIFNTSRREQGIIQGLQRAHKTYATTAIETLDKKKMDHCWEELCYNLRSLAEDLSEDVEEEVKGLIKKYRSDDWSHPDLGDFLEKQEGRCLGIMRIADKYQETVTNLQTALEGLNADEAGEFRNYEIDVKIHVFCNDCQKTREVEKAIIGVFVCTNQDKDDELAISALLEIKRAINRIPGISVVGAFTESVVLTVRCESGQSLLQLIKYINGQRFQDHLTSLETELEDQFDDIFHVFGNLTLDTLTRWFDPNSGQLKKQFEGGVVLSLASTSQEGSNLKRHIDDDLNIELQRERKRVKELRQEIDKLQRENRDLRRIQKQNEEVIHETKKENTLLEGYLNEMKQLDQITQIELEDSQAENKNLLNQINEITKHGEAEKFDLKIPLEKSVKERERLENVRMDRVLELKIQKSELEKR